MEKLISMTDFVLLDKHAGSPINMNKQYAHFLKQPLKLGMFVPCDEKGNILEDPGLIPSYKLEIYRKAKDRVLFEGVGEDYVYFIVKNYRNIEGLLYVTFDLYLTETARKLF